MIVTNYLWRPLFPAILDSVDEDGVLLYDTFARGNEAYGKPSNPDFLLEPGELIELVRDRLQVVAYEHGQIERPQPAIKQRLCAVCGDRPVALCSAPDARRHGQGCRFVRSSLSKRPSHQKARCAAGFSRV